MIFIFLSCLEKAHYNKEFSREKSRPHCESRIMTHYVELCNYKSEHKFFLNPLDSNMTKIFNDIFIIPTENIHKK